LSPWKKDGLLMDPMCGSGTILIEAAMIARNMAPGLKREFAAEKWPIIDKKVRDEARAAARKAISSDGKLNILGCDIDPERIKDCQVNARRAEVENDIVFTVKDIKELWINQLQGTLISNPPYGVKLASARALSPIYISIHNTFRKKKGWAVFVLTADKRFPNYFKRAKPDKVRKLFNGTIEVNYYQYYAGDGQETDKKEEIEKGG